MGGLGLILHFVLNSCCFVWNFIVLFFAKKGRGEGEGGVQSEYRKYIRFSIIY